MKIANIDKGNQLLKYFQLHDMVKSWDLHWSLLISSLINRVDWPHQQFCHAIYFKAVLSSLNYTVVTRRKLWYCVLSPLLGVITGSSLNFISNAESQKISTYEALTSIVKTSTFLPPSNSFVQRIPQLNRFHWHYIILKLAT